MIHINNNSLSELVEIIAEVEHEQWVFWTKEVIKLNRSAAVTATLEEQWLPSWIPYSELSEGQKELDRIWARKVLSKLEPYLCEEIF